MYNLPDYELAFLWWNSYLSHNCGDIDLNTSGGLSTLAQQIASADIAPSKLSTPRYRRLLRLVQVEEMKAKPYDVGRVEQVMHQWAQAFLSLAMDEEATEDELVTMLCDAYSCGWNGAELDYELEGE